MPQCLGHAVGARWPRVLLAPTDRGGELRVPAVCRAYAVLRCFARRALLQRTRSFVRAGLSSPRFLRPDPSACRVAASRGVPTRPSCTFLQLSSRFGVVAAGCGINGRVSRPRSRCSFSWRVLLLTYPAMALVQLRQPDNLLKTHSSNRIRYCIMLAGCYHGIRIVRFD